MPLKCAGVSLLHIRLYRIADQHLCDTFLLLSHLALQTLVVVMDGSIVGRGCVAPMRHVVSKGRAAGVAGPARRHGALARRPAYDAGQAGAQADPTGGVGGVAGRWRMRCDGIRLQHTGQQAGWSSVCRTGRHMTASWQGAPFRFATLGWWIRPGTLVALPEAVLTEDAYGPVLLICCWAKG